MTEPQMVRARLSLWDGGNRPHVYGVFKSMQSVNCQEVDVNYTNYTKSSISISVYEGYSRACGDQGSCSYFCHFFICQLFCCYLVADNETFRLVYLFHTWASVGWRSCFCHPCSPLCCACWLWTFHVRLPLEKEVKEYLNVIFTSENLQAFSLDLQLRLLKNGGRRCKRWTSRSPQQTS